MDVVGGVRGDQHVGHRPERTLRGQRLGLEHIEVRTRDVAGVQGIDQRRLIDYRPPRRIDKVRARLHRRERLSRQHPAGSGVQPHVQRHEVRAGKQLVERVRSVHLVRRRVRRRRPPYGQHPHAERLRIARDALPDPAEADHQQRAVPKRRERHRTPLPRALLLAIAQEPAAEREHRPGDALGEVRGEHAGAVGHGDPLGVPREQVVEPRAADLDPAHRGVGRDRHVPGGREPRMLDGEGNLRVVPREGVGDALRGRRPGELHIGKPIREQVPKVIGIAVGDEHRSHGFAPGFGVGALLPHRRRRGNARRRHEQSRVTLRRERRH